MGLGSRGEGRVGWWCEAQAGWLCGGGRWACRGSGAVGVGVPAGVAERGWSLVGGGGPGSRAFRDFPAFLHPQPNIRNIIGRCGREAESGGKRPVSTRRHVRPPIVGRIASRACAIAPEPEPSTNGRHGPVNDRPQPVRSSQKNSRSRGWQERLKRFGRVTPSRPRLLHQLQRSRVGDRLEDLHQALDGSRRSPDRPAR